MDRKKKEEGLLKWFKEELLPDLIERGRFSEETRNWSVEKCEFEITERGVDHFASSPYFLKLVLKNRDDPSETKDFYLVAKFVSQDPAFRAAMKTDGQFRNEAAMYNVVLPAFEEFLKNRGKELVNLMEELCPRSYHAEHDERSPGNSLVVLQDLRKSGFKVAESMVELDRDHCGVALNALARFHAVSLAMKIKSPEKLNELKIVAREIRYVDEPAEKEFGEKFFGLQSTRAIDYLLSKKDSEIPPEYLRKLRKIVTDSPVDLMMSLVRPKEPLALICHGDFCRNNILFRYDEKGIPAEARLFDFQTFRYGPVSHDLAFFFYMNTTLELREKHFDELFRAYHSTLIETAGKIAGISEDETRAAFPFRALQKEFAEHAVYGYVIASFFLPCMMSPQEGVDFEESFPKQSVEEMTAEIYERGGIVVTERIAEILVDFYRRKFYSNGTC